MWGDMSLWNVQGPLLHSGDHIVPRILTVDYTFNKDLLLTTIWHAHAYMVAAPNKSDYNKTD